MQNKQRSLRESFLKLLRREKPDSVVWTADLTYWVDGRVGAGLADPVWQSLKGHLELCRSHRVMPYYWYSTPHGFRAEYDGVETRTETTHDRRRRMWRTSAGELHDEHQQAGPSGSEAPVRYAVQTEEDLKVLSYILEHRRLVPCGLEEYRRCDELFARFDGVPIVIVPRTSMPALLTDWAGVANTAFLAADCSEMVRQVCALIDRQADPVLDALCELRPHAVHFADNLSSANSTSLFDEHMAGVYRRQLGKLHAAGIPCVVHLDGTVRGLLPKLAAIGFDAVESLTPAPVGDVPVKEMRRLAGREDLILWGGVPGAMFAAPFTQREVRDHVESLLDDWSAGPFVLGSADQIPPNGQIDFCDLIAQIAAGRGAR